MVNHTRTLLLNQSQGGYAWDFPGEEFVDPAFQPKRLPPHLLRLHQTLFGRTPDRFFSNYRLRQLMTVLHSTELEEYVLAADSRITYWPPDLELFDEPIAAEAIQLTGPPAVLYVAGTHDADEGLGLAQQSWRVEVLEDSAVLITRQRPVAVASEIAYATSGGLSLPIALSGAALTIRFHTSVAGTAWLVNSNGRPQGDIGQLLARIETSLGDAGVSQLFPPPLVEPVATFKRIWDTHPYFVHRFAALLLAAVTQLEALSQAT